MFRAFDDNYSNALVFLISQMKLTKRTENLELHLDVELGRAVL